MTEHVVSVGRQEDVEPQRELGPPPPEGDTVRYRVMHPLERVWFDICRQVAVNSPGWRFEMLIKRKWRKAFRGWIW